jgi:hypothetical protein
VLRSFISEELLYGADQGALANDQPLQETGVIDSMGMMRLVGWYANGHERP